MLNEGRTAQRNSDVEADFKAGARRRETTFSAAVRASVRDGNLVGDSTG
jgi:hypothetical protein